ncbi:hypothetical protein [Streptomyces sp. NPDC054804]
MPADHVYLDDMQVDALANASGAYRVFILLLTYTGLRWGEASALKVGRVDLDACRAHIVEAYAEDNGKLYLGTPKNHERRSVPIPRFLADELKPHVQGGGMTTCSSPPRRPGRCEPATSASDSSRRRS